MLKGQGQDRAQFDVEYLVKIVTDWINVIINISLAVNISRRMVSFAFVDPLTSFPFHVDHLLTILRNDSERPPKAIFFVNSHGSRRRVVLLLNAGNRLRNGCLSHFRNHLS